ncbi:MAG: HAMP domain-containing histidine kinase [Candidatus Omnitrophica bacterium]|nr:HAMP domain-containing histidine kinase [Candidatus Omnitrophota bacterium]
MKTYYQRLTHKITWAFVVLGLVIAMAAGVGLHYLEGIRVYQMQFEDEWEEYQRMVSAEDVLKEISLDISAWQAGMLPVSELKSKSYELTRILNTWTRDEQEEVRRVYTLNYEKQEARYLYPARQAFFVLSRAINNLHPKPTTLSSAVLIESLNQLQQASYPLRQFYFQSIQASLEKAQKARDRIQRDSSYFFLIVAVLVLGISIYSIKTLYGQARQLMEQERQIASVTLVQHLAHEIRNPLGIVKSAASVIAKRSTGEVVGLADDIVSEVERVDGLLTDLLHLRRGDSQPKEATDISALVLKVADLFASKIRAADLRLDVYNQAPGVFLPCRPDSIRQVLMNLLLNAIEASSEKNSIEMTMMVSGSEYMLQVRDHGTGMTPEQKQKIFDLMYTTKPYGFGIGLTVVKRIVEDHGGRIEVSNPPPEGTAFTIYLPMRI